MSRLCLARTLFGNGKRTLGIELAPALHVDIRFCDAIKKAPNEDDRGQVLVDDRSDQLAYPSRIGGIVSVYRYHPPFCACPYQISISQDSRRHCPPSSPELVCVATGAVRRANSAGRARPGIGHIAVRLC